MIKKYLINKLHELIGLLFLAVVVAVVIFIVKGIFGFFSQDEASNSAVAEGVAKGVVITILLTTAVFMFRDWLRKRNSTAQAQAQTPHLSQPVPLIAPASPQSSPPPLPQQSVAPSNPSPPPPLPGQRISLRKD